MDTFFATVLGDQWKFGLVTLLLVVAAAEFGYRGGLRLFRRHDEARRSQVSGVQGAVLALLGLLLGFTFSMGVARYEARREMVVKEANAIGTAFLRVGLLPEAHHAPMKDLFRQYVDVRLHLYEVQRDKGTFATGMKKSGEIENALWQHAESAAKEAPTPITASFILALNEMIDADAERISTGRNQIPGAVWFLLLIVAVFGCFTSGHASGCQGARSAFTSILLPALIAVVIVSIFDLTQGRQGLIRVSQQSMIDLRDSITPVREP